MALSLLDLFAAFLTIDYSVLPDSLSDWCGISGIAFTWILSFLINRFQSLKIRNVFKGSALRLSPRLCSWTATVYSAHHTTNLSYSQPQIKP